MAFSLHLIGELVHRLGFQTKFQHSTPPFEVFDLPKWKPGVFIFQLARRSTKEYVSLGCQISKSEQ